jgi:hypothetical protein
MTEKGDNRVHHQLFLYLRHEKEGHGTLFMSYSDEWLDMPTPDDECLEAIGIIGRYALDEAIDANVCVGEVAELLREKALSIAKFMVSIPSERPGPEE